MDTAQWLCLTRCAVTLGRHSCLWPVMATACLSLLRELDHD